MNKIFTAAGIAARIWLRSSLVLTLGISIFLLGKGEHFSIVLIPVSVLAAVALSSPAFTLLCIAIPLINKGNTNWQAKFLKLLLAEFLIALCYGIFSVPVMYSIERLFALSGEGLQMIVIVTGVLFGTALVATFSILKMIAAFFSPYNAPESSYNKLLHSLFYHSTIKTNIMETFDHEQQPQLPQQSQSNRLFIKGVITGVLILFMLVPTIFIINIVNERELRQKEVVTEVSSKWAKAQTIAAPYLVVPYTDTTVTSEGKTIAITKQLILLANDLNVDGKIFPEERPRSIYKVLLYKTDVQLSGSFKPHWPADVNIANIDFTNAKLCFGISDFKGIEEEIQINFNNKLFPLSPGLPLNDLNQLGLSVPVSFNAEAINNGIPFSMHIKLKGSEQFHFIPLSANSKFNLASSWPNPSFDGNVLPNHRAVSEKGFTAKWNFNQANLPFGTVLKQGAVDTAGLAFGVTMVQPADQYDKTLRSVKYAILFIGLTFALFFIIEIMQRKPFHPVQYALVGLALVIFYTLLLSISEYLLFDYAYFIAAAATVLLISLYAKSHFESWKTATVFFTTLSLLYGFIFILIRLEDTALLVGSIGLFIVLSLVMYASRKIQWYGKS